MTATLFRPVTALMRGWRRSLQLRAVLVTIVLATICVASVGTLLERQIVNGILDTKARNAVAEASRGFAEAQLMLSSGGAVGGAGNLAPNLMLRSFVERYAEQSGSGGSEVIVLGTGFTTVTSGPSASSIPPELQDAILRSEVAYRAYGTLSDSASGTGATEVALSTEPALMVGRQVRAQDGTPYQVYFIFSLTQEQETVAVVQRILLAGGALLLGLIGLVAWVVVRRTVSPVRHAARIAERLAAGGLQERMHVRGEDDMARLATSFNRMASSLQHQIKQLEDLSRMQQRFVSDVSHELRTPLTTVRMAADVLHDARSQLDPPAARAAELLQNELDRFENLLGELLEISRFDAGAAVLETELVDCRALVEQVVSAARPLAARAGTELSAVLPPEPCIAEVDPRRITRILRNLIENAIEHGEARPVEVTVAADATTVGFTVRDHGIGLRPGEAASVFNRFWRADPSRGRTIGGTGLGLAISLEDTHLHDGWLQAWGRSGVGSQFRLTLPRVRGGVVESSPLPMVPAARAATEVPAAVTQPAGDREGPVGAGAARG